LHHLLLAGLPAHAQRNPGSGLTRNAIPGLRLGHAEGVT
jgi:hypothetical protein